MYSFIGWTKATSSRISRILSNDFDQYFTVDVDAEESPCTKSVAGFRGRRGARGIKGSMEGAS